MGRKGSNTVAASSVTYVSATQLKATAPAQEQSTLEKVLTSSVNVLEDIWMRPQ